MKKNIGPKNRAARLIIGAAVIGLASLYLGEPWRFMAIAAGGLMITEAVLGFCVLHSWRGTKDMR